MNVGKQKPIIEKVNTKAKNKGGERKQPINVLPIGLKF